MARKLACQQLREYWQTNRPEEHAKPLKLIGMPIFQSILVCQTSSSFWSAIGWETDASTVHDSCELNGIAIRRAF